jgi:hypothetical protein
MVLERARAFLFAICCTSSSSSSSTSSPVTCSAAAAAATGKANAQPVHAGEASDAQPLRPQHLRSSRCRRTALELIRISVSLSSAAIPNWDRKLSSTCTACAQRISRSGVFAARDHDSGKWRGRRTCGGGAGSGSGSGSDTNPTFGPAASVSGGDAVEAPQPMLRSAGGFSEWRAIWHPRRPDSRCFCATFSDAGASAAVPRQRRTRYLGRPVRR